MYRHYTINYYRRKDLFSWYNLQMAIRQTISFFSKTRDFAKFGRRRFQQTFRFTCIKRYEIISVFPYCTFYKQGALFDERGNFLSIFMQLKSLIYTN